MIKNTLVDKLHADPKNPRKSDVARLGLLRLSIRKLGFIQPIFATAKGMILSGHQRLTIAAELGLKRVPVCFVDPKVKDVQGINILFNRATNDFSAFDTGSGAKDRLYLGDIIEQAEALPDFEGEDWFAIDCKDHEILSMGREDADKYSKKAVVLATSVMKMGVEIPVVISTSGKIVNGVNRLFAAKEAGRKTWPTIIIPDDLAEVAVSFLNYLSMDYHIDSDFADMMRYSAYRRPQNNRGNVPKAYRFWANGNRTLMDKDSYSKEYWRKFRDLHGPNIIDFGAGLGKVKPFLNERGMNCIDFEPYRIDPDKEVGTPNPDYSKQQAREFLDSIADGEQYNSIFLASVMNSIPFPKDRLAVLAIVNALSTKDTVIYGTCRDMSDFNYEYGGVRNANYFVFDSEPGVRLGDVMRNPKVQKFETKESADLMFSRLWNTRDYWPGGNVFYFRLASPKGCNMAVLAQALEIEFNLPYAPCDTHPTGSTMGLVAHAKKCFGKRLGVKL